MERGEGGTEEGMEERTDARTHGRRWKYMDR